MAERELIDNLLHPQCYPHAVAEFQVIETHLSYVILTGEYAYKIKKSVNLGFADFSTLAKRKYYCEQELLLNKKLAEHIYLAVIPIIGTKANPRLAQAGNDKVKDQDKSSSDGKDKIIEYAVKLRQFAQKNILKNVALAKQYLPKPQAQLIAPNNNQHAQYNSILQIMYDIAKQIASLHQQAEIAELNSPYGSYELIQQAVLDNFKICKKLIPKYFTSGANAAESTAILAKLKQLQQWTQDTCAAKENFFINRKRHKFIKHGHGDLHLSNIVLINNQPTIFDCIEFNPEFYYIDQISDVAFLCMDLLSIGQQYLMFVFLNQYLIYCGDYQGLFALKFYMVYRAMVRAKVMLLTASAQAVSEFSNYVDLATRIIAPNKIELIIMYGLSGSGKSTISEWLAAELGAIRVRSDVERKRLAQLQSIDQLYSAAATHKTYAKLLELSGYIMSAGYTVIVDACFLQATQREQFAKLAATLTVPFRIIHCCASEAQLIQRLELRQQQDADPSDADVEVLKQQQLSIEPLTGEEQQNGCMVDTSSAPVSVCVTKLIACLTAT